MASIKPKVEKSLYRCNVAGRILFKRFQLSGLLYLVQTEQQETHVIFQNEIGLNYFHFIWNQQDSFSVASIMTQMNKPALIKTLKKDFEMLLLHIHSSAPESFYERADHSTLMRVPIDRGFVDYAYNGAEKTWSGVTLVDDRRVITEIQFAQPAAWQTLPDTLQIRHRAAGFTINLKKLNTHDDRE